MNNNRKKLLVFHHSDLDGMGVKLVGMMYAKLHGMDVETFKCNYSDVDTIITDRLQKISGTDGVSEILIGDISVQSKETAGILDVFNQVMEVNLLDHHATATWLNKYPWASVKEKDEYGVDRCGTYWVANYLFPSDLYKADSYPNLRTFVEWVDLYDTWKWMADPKNPITKADDLNSLFKVLGEEAFTDNMFRKLFSKEELLGSTERLIITVHNKGLDNKAHKLDKNMKVFDFEFKADERWVAEELYDYYKETYKNNTQKLKFAKKSFSKYGKYGYKETFKVGMVFESENISELGNRLLQLHPEIDFLIFVALPNLVSYRSAKELTVPLGIMAKYMTGCGGGHPCSAGGSLNPSLVDKAINKLFPKIDI